MILLFLATLSLAAFANSNHLHPQCPHQETHLHPIALSEILGKWNHIVSAYGEEEYYNADKESLFGWMEIFTVDGMTKQRYVSVQHGQTAVLLDVHAIFSVKDGYVNIQDDDFKVTSQVHKLSDDCIVFVMTNHSDSMSVVGNVLFCRSSRGNDADVEAFKTHSQCKHLKFIIELRHYFNYATECDSLSHIMDPLDHNRVTNKWYGAARATMHPRAIEGKNHWAEFSWEEDKLSFQVGFDNTIIKEEVEVEGHNIIFGKVNTTSMAFYRDCDECLLTKTETHLKDVFLYMLTPSGKHTDSQMKTLHTVARCLNLPSLHMYGGEEVHEEEGSDCIAMSHILDVFVPNKISAKWLLVAKAHSNPDPMDEEENPWVEYSWDGEHLTVHQGHGKDSWEVKDVVVKGPKLVVGKENSACVTYHSTCKDCLLTKIKKDKEVILKLYTKSGKLTASEIKTFKENAHCLNLSNVLVYKSATPHED